MMTQKTKVKALEQERSRNVRALWRTLIDLAEVTDQNMEMSDQDAALMALLVSHSDIQSRLEAARKQ